MTKSRISQQKKTTCRIVDVAILADHRVKVKENKKKVKYQDLARVLKKKQQLRNMKVIVIQIIIQALGPLTKGLIQGLENLEMRGRVQTIEYWENPVDLSKFAFIPILARNHRLTLVWKTRKRVNENNINNNIILS